MATSATRRIGRLQSWKLAATLAGMLATLASNHPAASAQDVRPTAKSYPQLPELSFAEIRGPSRDNYVGDRFSFMESGKHGGPPVVLLHGIGTNSANWRWQLSGLSDRFRVIAWNAPGYMLTDDFKKDAVECRDFANAFRDFLDALKLERIYVVANSYGSWISLCFMLDHPDRIVRLVTTGTFIGIKNPTEQQRRQAFDAREKQVSNGGYGFGARVNDLVGSNASSEARESITTSLRAVNPRGFLRAVHAGFSFYSLDHADRFKVPHLLIQGTEDKVTPTDRFAGVFAKAVPTARLELLEGVGHMPEAEAPDRVNALIREFLSE